MKPEKNDQQSPAEAFQRQKEGVWITQQIVYHPCRVIISIILLAVLLAVVSFSINPLSVGEGGVYEARGEKIVENYDATIMLDAELQEVAQTPQQSRTLFNLMLFFETNNNSDIFTPGALAYIQDVEESVLNVKDYSSYCLFEKGQSSCLPPVSPPQEAIDLCGITANGWPRVCPAFRAELRANSDEVAFLLPNVYDTALGAADATRSLFQYGFPLEGFTYAGQTIYDTNTDFEDQVEILYDWEVDYVKPLLVAKYAEGQRHGITLSWFSFNLFLSEFESMFDHDLLLLAMAFVLVLAVMIVHLESVFLAGFGLLHILMSYPIAHALYFLVFQLKVSPGMNNLGLFVVLGIGADDIFIIADAFQQSHVAGKAVNRSLLTKVTWAYRRAAKTMFVTTLTTFMAFVAAAFNPIPAVRALGIFTASLVFVNYVFVITYYQSMIVIWSRYFEFRTWFLRKKPAQHIPHWHPWSLKTSAIEKNPVQIEDVELVGEREPAGSQSRKTQQSSASPNLQAPQPKKHYSASLSAIAEANEGSPQGTSDGSPQTNQANPISPNHKTIGDNSNINSKRTHQKSLVPNESSFKRAKEPSPIIFADSNELITPSPNGSAVGGSPFPKSQDQGKTTSTELAREKQHRQYRLHGLRPEELGRVERFFFFYFAPLVKKIRFWIIGVCLILFVLSVIATTQISPPSEAENGLPSHMNAGKAIKLVMDYFPASEQGFRVEIFVVWGVSGTDRSGVDMNDERERGKVVFNPEFSFATPEEQNGVWKLLSRIGESDLVFGDNADATVLGTFRNWREDQNKTAVISDVGVLNSELNRFMKEQWDQEADLGFTKDGFVKWLRIPFNSTLDFGATTSELETEWDRWNALFDLWEREDNPPLSVRRPFISSEMFSWMRTSQVIVRAAILGIIAALALGYLTLLIATLNVVIASLAIMTIIFVVFAVTASMVLFGWHMGFLEALSLIIVVGLSIDSPTHLAIAYTESPAKDSWRRMRYSLTTLGVSIFGAAVSTIIASVPLVFAWFLFFVRFGIFIIITISYAFLFGIFLFSALAITFGPEGQGGDMKVMYRKWKKQREEKKKLNAKAKREEGEPSSGRTVAVPPSIVVRDATQVKLTTLEGKQQSSPTLKPKTNEHSHSVKNASLTTLIDSTLDTSQSNPDNRPELPQHSASNPTLEKRNSAGFDSEYFDEDEEEKHSK